MPTYSGYWKQTIIIDDTDGSESETVYFRKTGDLYAAALPVARGFVIKRKDLLGRGYDASGTNIVTSAAPGSPCILAMRLHDALNPRLGKTFLYQRHENLGKVYDPTPTSDARREDAPADPTWNTLHVRFYAAAAGAGPNGDDLLSKRDYQLRAIPDGVTSQGKYASNDTTLGIAWNVLYNQWKAYLFANQFGMMAQSTVAPYQLRDLEKFEFENHQPIVTVKAGGASTGIDNLQDGDRVRLSRCNAKFWNGEYKINIVGDGSARKLLLVQGPLEGRPLPTAGYLRRLRPASGQQTKIFCPFNDEDEMRVSSMPPGRPFSQSHGGKKSKAKKLPKWVSDLVAAQQT